MRIDPNLALSPARTFSVALALVTALGALALTPGCVDDATNPTPAPKADASAPPTGDAGATDAGLRDTSTTDPADAAVDSPIDVAPCPIPADATVAAFLHVTADNRRTVSVNGVVVEATENEWSTPTVIAITLFRHPSRQNVVAIEGRNLSSQSGLDRGIIADIELGTGADAGVDAGAWPVAQAHLVTDATWKIAKTAPTGWTDVDFNDSSIFDAGAFASATAQGKNGVAPWGTLAGFSADAQWIWTSDSSGATTEKANVESAYARRAFYFDVAGGVGSAPTTCP